MGIQINGNTNNINAGIGSLSIEDLNELHIVGFNNHYKYELFLISFHQWPARAMVRALACCPGDRWFDPR